MEHGQPLTWLFIADWQRVNWVNETIIRTSVTKSVRGHLRYSKREKKIDKAQKVSMWVKKYCYVTIMLAWPAGPIYFLSQSEQGLEYLPLNTTTTELNTTWPITTVLKWGGHYAVLRLSGVVCFLNWISPEAVYVGTVPEFWSTFIHLLRLL